MPIKNSCYIIFIEWTFYHFVIYNSMSTTVYGNGTVKFTYAYCNKLNFHHEGLIMYRRNMSEMSSGIKYGFIK